MHFRGHQSFISTAVGQHLDFKSKLKAGCRFQKQRCKLTGLFLCTFSPLNNIIIELSGQIVASWTEYKVTVLKTEYLETFQIPGGILLRRRREGMSLLSQQKPACTHDIFTFLPRCCHRKKISEYKPCPTKHRWEQALSSSLLFHFSPFLATPWGPGPLYVRLSPCFWTVPVNITNIQIGERELALQRETGQPKQG